MTSPPSRSSLPPRPNPSSGPSAVRSYLASILSDLHGVPANRAADIAAGWKFGGGAELMYYDLQTFRDMFGSEAGVLLYGHARQRGSSRAPLPGSTRDPTAEGFQLEKDLFGLEPGLSLVVFFMALMIASCVAAFRYYDPSAVANPPSKLMAISTVVNAISFVVSYVLFYQRGS